MDIAVFLLEVLMCVVSINRCQANAIQHSTYINTVSIMNTEFDIGNGFKNAFNANVGEPTETTESFLKRTRDYEVQKEKSSIGNGDKDDEGDKCGDGEPSHVEGALLHQRASLIVGVLFVPGLVMIYVFCRYVPDKILIHVDDYRII